MEEQLWREILRGMHVVTADGHSLGRVGEVYFTNLRPGPEPGSLLSEREPEVRDTGEGAAPSPDRSRSAIADAERYFCVQHPIGGRDIYVPLDAVARVEGDVVELGLTLNDLESGR